MRCWTLNRWVVGCASMILLGMFLLIPKRGLPQEDTGISFGDKSWMIVFFCVTSEELEQLEKQGGGYVWFRIWGYWGMGCCYTQWNDAWNPKNTTQNEPRHGLAWPFPASFGGPWAISFPPNWTPATGHKKWLTSSNVSCVLLLNTWSQPHGNPQKSHNLVRWGESILGQRLSLCFRGLCGLGAWCGSPKIKHGRGFGDSWCSFSPIHFEIIYFHNLYGENNGMIQT